MPRIRPIAVLAVSPFSAPAIVQAQEKFSLRAQFELLARITSDSRASVEV